MRALMVSAGKAYRGSEKASRPVLIGRGRAPLVDLTGSLRGRRARSARHLGESCAAPGTDSLQFELAQFKAVILNSNSTNAVRPWGRAHDSLKCRARPRPVALLARPAPLLVLPLPAHLPSLSA